MNTGDLNSDRGSIPAQTPFSPPEFQPSLKDQCSNKGFYKHSEGISVFGAALTVIAGAMLAGLLGFVYGVAVRAIPYIYLLPFVTVGIGIAIGRTIAAVAMAGRMRSPSMVSGVAVVCALAGLYCAWSANYLLSGPILLGEIWLDRFRPTHLAGYIAWFYENGQWGFGRHIISVDKPRTVSGFPLACIWLLESAIIVGVAAVTARKKLQSRAFCEHCGGWVGKPLVHLLSAADAGSLLNHLRANDFSTLAEVERVAPSLRHYLEIVLETCGCSSLAVLSVHEVSIIRQRGKKNTAGRVTLLDKKSLAAEPGRACPPGWPAHVEFAA